MQVSTALFDSCAIVGESELAAQSAEMATAANHAGTSFPFPKNSSTRDIVDPEIPL
jgi:hypothetical protein